MEKMLLDIQKWFEESPLNSMVIIFVSLFAFMLLIVLLGLFTGYKRRKKIEATIFALANNSLALSPEDFFQLRNNKLFGRSAPMAGKVYDFPGVYIIYNQTKNMHYVGQSLRVFDRVNNHFTGKGNGDIYADYMYGDSFEIRMIGIEGSGYLYLNDLERDTIAAYKAFSNGYNRTRGNM